MWGGGELLREFVRASFRQTLSLHPHTQRFFCATASKSKGVAESINAIVAAARAGRDNEVVAGLSRLSNDTTLQTTAEYLEFTPLHLAVFGNAPGSHRVVSVNHTILPNRLTPTLMFQELLLRPSTLVEKGDANGLAPAHLAAALNNALALEMLLDKNPNVAVARVEGGLSEYKGWSPLHLAANSGSEQDSGFANCEKSWFPFFLVFGFYVLW